MLFNSLEFLIFLPIVLAVYYLLPHRAQNRFLLVASCFFYGSWDWRFLFPLLASTSIDYYCAKRMEQQILAGEPKENRKKWLALSVITNLALLGFFKYFDFFADNLHQLLQLLGMSVSVWTLRVILPIGISFYTFQALSYTIDVFRGEIHATDSFFDFLLAVLYFPHLVAGPIQRANSLLPQVTNPRTVTKEKIVNGLHLIFWGFFKKVFIADNLAPLVSQLFDTHRTPDGWHTLMGVYAFAVQIYCDFSGYTDIARGVARLMGFEFMLNFNLPYLATNASDFWRRWHISLSTWLRDYLYKSLGGNRGGEAKTNRNLMLTMVIGGFWHGAAWNFLLWGFYHGALLVAHRYAKPALDRVFAWPGRLGQALSFALLVVVFFHFTCYGWLLFRAASLAQVVAMTASFFGPWQVDWSIARDIALFSSPLILVQLVQFASGKLEFLSFRWISAEARVAIYAAMSYFVLFRGGAPQSFIYFQF
jgi:D-alanyl-lipoteichoic acid acyltransferase DltB (MBOAT superfamily)